jgi:uncharacterized repeat protein (TIGR03803 family)
MKSQKNSHSSSPPLAILIAVLMLAGNSLAKAVLHTFRGGGDGIAPYGRLISDAEGNLYGTTAFGGASGAGVVFELTKSSAGWTETILYSFTDGNDGAQPWAGLIFDSAGNLYGTTYRGGAFNAGTVYELTPGRNISVVPPWKL